MNTTIPRSNKNLLIASGVLLLITAVYTLMSMWNPMMLDDYVFKATYLHINSLSPDFSLDSFLEYMKEVRDNDNSRIPNLIAPFSTTFVPWKYLFPLFTGMAIAMVIAISTRIILGNKWREYPLAIAIVWLAFILLIPWRNNLFVAAYSLNYIYSAAATMIFIGIALHILAGHYSAGAVAALCILAFPTGMWHEGFALPTLLGFFVITLRNIKEKKWWWWLAGGLFAAGALYAILSPGTISRMSEQTGTHPTLSTVMIVDYAGVVMMVLLLASLSLFKGGRTSIRICFASDTFLLFFAIICAAGLLSFVLPHSPRMAFYPDFCAIICSALICKVLVERVAPLHRILSKYYYFLCISALLLSLVHSAASLAWQYTIKQEEKDIIPLIFNSPTHTVFYDYIDQYDIPAYTLFFPQRGVWISAFTYQTMNEYMKVTGMLDSNPANPAVLPLELKDATPGTYRHGLVTDSIFVSQPCVADLSGTIEYESGEVRNVEGQKCMALPFINQSGKKLIFLHPLGKGNTHIKNIKASKIKPED